MSIDVARAVAGPVNEWAAANSRFSVVWHGGEPMVAGRDLLGDLMAPFHGVEHHVQTNATLVDDAWCDFFAEHDMRVSVSVDGPAARNTARVTRAGASAYTRIERGIATLRRRGIPFAALCVVSDPGPDLAAELYRYFLDLGCEVLGINIEEQEGVNLRTNAHSETTVREFWAALVSAWRREPRIHVREIEYTLRYAGAVLAGTADDVLPRRLDPIPTIAADGRVFVLSPELAGFTDETYGDFSSGNVLDTPLPELLAVAATGPGWVGEFLTGIEACRSSCPYFGFCGGAHAANRYFELGRFDTMETDHCRNSKIRLLEGVLDHAATH
jgi:uncharacterized protein